MTPFELIQRLSKAKIYFELRHHREDYLMVIVTVPGERWEIELTPAGEMEIEVFRSGGEIPGREKLDDLFERFSD